VKALETASFDAIYDAYWRHHMRTTISIDDELMDILRVFTGEKENIAVIRTALRGYAEREAARRLALLGGSAPDLRLPPRRRSTAA
jgi:Arc/MetJ family transcription regulator